MYVRLFHQLTTMPLTQLYQKALCLLKLNRRSRTHTKRWLKPRQKSWHRSRRLSKLKELHSQSSSEEVNLQEKCNHNQSLLTRALRVSNKDLILSKKMANCLLSEKVELLEEPQLKARKLF